MDSRKLLKDKKAEILRLAEKWGARNVRVFGSVARGEARPDSDIDLLVEILPETSLLDHIALVDDLEYLLGRKVDVVSDRGIKPRFREQILQEAVPI